jgi:hypothetical protein
MEAKSIQLYQLAHKKLHLMEKDAMEFVDLIQGSIEERTDELVTKEYLNVRIMELEIKMVKSEKTLIMWIVSFWIGQLAAMWGFLYLFLKH